MVKKKPPSRWNPLLFVLVSGLVALLLAEALTRATMPSTRHWFPKGMYVSDPVVGYRLAPNYVGEVATPFFQYQVRTSSEGFRGPEFAPLPSKKVVALFGDSYTFGQGVEEADSFAGIMAKELAPAGRRFTSRGKDTRIPRGTA